MGKSKNAKQNREGLAELTKAFAEPEYIRKQSYAIATVESLIRQYEQRKGAKHKVIDSVSERIKTAASAAEKLERKGYEISYEQAVQRLNDLAGVRIVCSFRDEVYQVAEYLIEHPQLTIIKTKDYIFSQTKNCLNMIICKSCPHCSYTIMNISPYGGNNIHKTFKNNYFIIFSNGWNCIMKMI